MIFLKAIGAFFVKIWRWIKETAWVQPLLIVGAIFGIIFSIPYITDWANSFTLNSANSFYNANKRNLEGETDDGISHSAADVFTDSVYTNTVTKFYKGSTDFVDLATYGSKFFLIFADSTNSTSKTNETAFKYLSDKWGNYGLVPSAEEGKDAQGNYTSNLPFKYYTIFKDDTSSNDSDDAYDNDTNNSAWKRYVMNHLDLFESTYDKLEEAPYKTRASIADDNYLKFGLDGSDASSFPIPSVCLVDYSAKAVAANRAGLSEIVFTVTGETDAGKANFLMNMWNHCDAYSATNLFTALQ